MPKEIIQNDSLLKKTTIIGINMGLPWLGSIISAYKYHTIPDFENLRAERQKYALSFQRLVRKSAIATCISTATLVTCMGLSLSKTIDFAWLHDTCTLNNWDGIVSNHSLSSASGISHLNGIVLAAILFFVVLPMILRSLCALSSDIPMPKRNIITYGIVGDGNMYFKKTSEQKPAPDRSSLASSHTYAHSETNHNSDQQNIRDDFFPVGRTKGRGSLSYDDSVDHTLDAQKFDEQDPSQEESSDPSSYFPTSYL